MNELIIIGILIAIFLMTCAFTWVVENGRKWLEERITEHYVCKMNRERRKTRYR